MERLKEGAVRYVCFWRVCIDFVLKSLCLMKAFGKKMMLRKSTLVTRAEFIGI
jgi:hypothetical protein